MSIQGCKIGDFLCEKFKSSSLRKNRTDSSIWPRTKIAMYIHRDDVPLHETQHKMV